MAKRRTFAEQLVDTINSGWFLDRDRDKHWVVYVPGEGRSYHVEPPTKKNAKREARLLDGEFATAMPYMLARTMSNAFNHGRASARQS